uniref:Uncharacterized protein n=1 Tax=Sparus aurata TaxID=8175 RepID=A0A671YLA2_SPAAU
ALYDKSYSCMTLYTCQHVSDKYYNVITALDMNAMMSNLCTLKNLGKFEIYHGDVPIPLIEVLNQLYFHHICDGNKLQLQ